MKKLYSSAITGFLFTIVAGTLLHFLYQWSGENRVIGLYSAVSESTWEHLKLLFFPSLLYTVWEYFWIGHRYAGYAFTRLCATLLGMLTIVSLFYTYTGIAGTNWLVADILVFILGSAVTSWYSWHFVPKCNRYGILGVLLFAVVAVCFGVFTFYPPSFGMFLAP